MRRRLAAAVRALLDHKSLAALPDSARLGALVLMAKAQAATRRTAIWAAELGRWLGLSESTVAHVVLPRLRDAGAVKSRAVTGKDGKVTGLDCVVLPLWRARRDPANPLALTRKELATLLRLVEALFGPGWATTAPGMLADRQGRGAATDRLALLLLTLEARADGRVRLVGGSVADRRGRAGATVARMLGCTTSGGTKVVSRLAEWGVIEAPRKKTGSGLFGKAKLMIPAVAAAHRGSGTGENQRHASALGESVPRIRLIKPATTGESRGGAGPTGGIAEHPASASLHALHSSVADPASESAALLGVSGEAVVGDRRRPKCGQAREERERNSPTPPAAVMSSALGRLLAPVSDVWGRVSRSGARARVSKAVRDELAALAGVLGESGAEQALRARLETRVAEQGPAVVLDPVGWLIGKALPRRAGCYDVRCDGGVRMDTGAACDACSVLVGDRRAERAAVASQVAAELPSAAPEERRGEVERRLRERVSERGARQALAREKAVPVARTPLVVAAPSVAPCGECGEPRPGGVCEPCASLRAREHAVVRAAELTAVVRGAVGGVAGARAVELVRGAEAELRAELERVGTDAREAGASAHTLSLLLRWTAEEAVGNARREALAVLGAGPEAEEEARRAHRIETVRGRMRRSGEDRADEVAEQARVRAAEQLLTERLAGLRLLREAPSGTASSARVREARTERLAVLAARALPEEMCVGR
ncbi:hypothetical protein ABT160_16570 [Streptomyces sp. NPDC001941]|uniref:hypothetical protein n=1 Tax=Streptomyces sp. NPDC001941 TaxID=3154659 RepID=UPI00332E4002